MTFLKIFDHQQEALNMLDDDSCGKIIKAMMRYVFQEEDSSFDNTLLNVVWAQYRGYIDACVKKAVAGKIGGEKTQSKRGLVDGASGNASSDSDNATVASSIASSSASSNALGSASGSALSNASSGASSSASSQVHNHYHYQYQNHEHNHDTDTDKGGVGGNEISPGDMFSSLDTIDEELQKAPKKRKKETCTLDDLHKLLDKEGITGALRDTYDQFIAMRNADAKKKIKTVYTLELIVREVNKLCNTDDEKIKVLEQSIRKGWMDVFPVKDNNPFPRTINSVEDVASIGRQHRNPFLEKLKELEEQEREQQRNA